MASDILKIVFLLVAVAFGLCILASFTVIPMMANYRECGTIFLCANQH